MKTEQKNSLTSISEWFLSPTTEKAPTKVSTIPESTSLVEGTLQLDGAASVSTKQGREDDETAIIRTSTSEEPDEPNFLDWRMNPKTSLADWTIVISTPGRTPAKYYHVHRNIIMLPSRYFRKLFKKQRKTGGRSDFHLPEAAASVFPEFLDYVYRLGCDHFNRENAIPLYYLSRIFNVERLRWETRKFWESDMSVATIAHYYQAAILFEEEPLMIRVLQACADEEVLTHINCDSDVLANDNPRMMMYLVENSDKKHSEKLSILVTKYCSLHAEKINKEIFLNLTKFLTSVALEAACSLLVQERTYARCAGISQLQESCIKTLSENWASLEVSSEAFKEMLGLQGSAFLAELFRKTTLAAQGRPEKEEVVEQTKEESADEIVEDVGTPDIVHVVPKVSFNPVDPILCSTDTEDDVVREVAAGI